MTPYQYVTNNPIMFTDPTGMIQDGPGDEFATLEEAAKDFANEYNGLSISYNVEIGTNFYEAKNSDGQSYISYTTPYVGGSGVVEMVNNLEEGQTIIASGHTHSGDTDIFTEKVNGKTKYFSNANQFSTPDLRLSKNIDKNPFDKPIIGIVVTPNGGILLYDPEKKYEMITIDGIKGYYGKTPSFNKPIDTSVPSDPSSGPLRLNENSPDFVPLILPEGFDLKTNKKRDGY